MSVLEFTKENGLQEIDDPANWGQCESIEQYIKSIGFDSTRLGSIGDIEFGIALSWFGSLSGTKLAHRYKFVACFEDDFQQYPILVTDLAALFLLQALFSPIIQAARLNSFCDDVSMIAEKAFFAWHNHSGHSDCRRCDPESVERRERIKMDLMREKKEKEN